MSQSQLQLSFRGIGHLILLLASLVVLSACDLADNDPPNGEPPPDPNQTAITSFTTDAAYVDRGDQVTLSWVVKNPGADPSVAEPCTITRQAEGEEAGEAVGVDCTGELTEVPAAPASSAYVRYELNVLKAVEDGSDPFLTRTVTIYFIAQETAIAEFTASDEHVDRGTEVTLAWTVENPGSDPAVAEPCTITRQAEGEPPSEPEAVDCISQLTEVPPAPTSSTFLTYTLDALDVSPDATEPYISATVTIFFNPSETTGEPLWSRDFGSAGDVRAFAIAVDRFGNSFVAGDATGALAGASNGGIDAFVRAYGADGNHVWTRQFGTAQDDVANAAAVDAHGNLYVAGATRGPLEGANAGGADGFLRKYDSGGAELWTAQFGTIEDDAVYAIALDLDGYPVLVGTTHGDLSQAVSGASDMFVRQYDASGDHQWTAMHGGSGPDEGRGVAVHEDGNIFVSGSTEGTHDLMESPTDGILLKLDDLGVEEWSNTTDIEAYDVANAVAVDDTGASYLAVDTFNVAGDIFTHVVKVDPTGVEDWSESVSGTSNTVLERFQETSRSGIATDWVGNIVVVARVQDHIPGPAEGARVQKLDPAGEELWTTDHSDEELWTIPTSVAIDGAGNVYMAGQTAVDGSDVARLNALAIKMEP